MVKALISRLIGKAPTPIRREGPRVAIALCINGQTRILIRKDKT